MAERPKHWIKLWVSWLTTPAHLELSGGALGLGPLLLLLATWDGEYDSGGWLLGEDGKPYSKDALARATHRSRAELDRQILELVRVGTLVVDGNGAFGFRRFGRWQCSMEQAQRRALREDDGKKSYVYFALDGRGRMKIGFSRNPWARVRDLSREQKSKVELVAKIVGTFADERAHHERFADLRINGEWFTYEGALVDYVAELRTTTEATTVATTYQTSDDQTTNYSLRSSTPTPPREGSSSGISTETRAEAEALSLAASPKPSKPRKPRAAYPPEFEAAFVEAFDAAAKGIGRLGLRQPLSATYRDALRKLWAAEQPSVDDVRHVIAVRAALDAAGEGFGELAVLHLCRAEQFVRYREKRMPTGRAKAWTPSDFGEGETGT